MAPKGIIEFEQTFRGRTFGPITAAPDGNLWFADTGGLSSITPSGTLTNFNENIALIFLTNLTSGPGGALWAIVGAYGSPPDSASKITLDGVIRQTFSLSSRGSRADGIATGPDGALWYTDEGNNLIGRIAMDGSITTFAANGPYAITAGPDGALWYTHYTLGLIGRITTDGVVTEFPATPGAFYPAITAGPDGNLWLTEQPIFSPAGKVGRMTTSGVLTEFDVPGYVGWIVSGPGGELWFPVSASFPPGGYIAASTTDGVINLFAFPGEPDGDITVGSDGNLWFTGVTYSSQGVPANAVYRLTPGGNLTQFSNDPRLRPQGIIAGTDGGLWFDESYDIDANFNPQIMRLATDGAFTPVAAHTTSSAIHFANGPDGRLWFTQRSGRLARMSAIVGVGQRVISPENTPLASGAASFVDGTPSAQAGDFTASVSWGDGSSSSSAVAGPQGGPFSVGQGHVFKVSGTYSVVVTLHDRVDNVEYTSTPGTVTVLQSAATRLTLTAGSNPSAFAQSVTFTANVRPRAFGTPTGTVQFVDGGNNLGPPVALSNGIAVLTTSALPVGVHNITAIYSGDNAFIPCASPSLTQVITAAGGAIDTTSVLTIAPSQTFFRQTVALSIQVTPASSGPATGNVILLDGDDQLGPVLTLDGTGSATYSAPLRPGVHRDLTAVYLGNSTFNGSASSAQAVNASSKPNPH